MYNGSIPDHRWTSVVPKIPDDWGLNVLPLPDNEQSLDYLPRLFKTLVNEIHWATGADPFMIETQVLGHAALALQGLYDQQRPNCDPSPVSLFVLIIARASYMKSTVQRMLAKPFHEFDQSAANIAAGNKNAARARRRSLELRIKACEKAIARAWQDPAEQRKYEEQLAALFEQEEPEKLPPKLIYDDATWPALVRGMHESSPSAAIDSDEASQFFSGHLEPFLARIQKTWDGSSLMQDRVSSESFTLDDARLTLILALQPRAFSNYLRHRGLDVAELGFFPRTLVMRAKKPDRSGVAGRKDVSHEARAAWHAWVTRHLQRYAAKLKAGELTREIKPWSDDAGKQWNATYEWLARAMSSNGSLEHVEGYAGKCGDHIARIALLYQMAEDESTNEISGLNMTRAVCTCKRYTEQYVEMFGSLNIPQDEVDATAIEGWLKIYSSAMQHGFVTRREVQQHTHGGVDLRNDYERLNNALKCLECEGKIKIDGSRIHLNPRYFGPGSLVLDGGRQSGLFHS